MKSTSPEPTAQGPAIAERLYAALLLLYPRAFRRQFGADMQDLFRDRLRADGATSTAWTRTLLDVVVSATCEHGASMRDRLISQVVPQPVLGAVPTSGDSMLATIWYDVRHTLRTLRKAPTFALVAIGVIALGSGAVTTIFSAASALVLRPIPAVDRPAQLVDIARTDLQNGRSYITPSYPFYTHVRDEAHALQGVAAWAIVQLSVSTGAQGTSALGNVVSANYFSVLGVRPALGRFFVADEDNNPGGHAVIVLSDGFWRRRFAADPSIVGKSVLVNSTPYTVIGVAPAKFSGTYPVIRTDAWVPLIMAATLGRDPRSLTNPGFGWLTLFGRLKDGTSVVQARADVARVAAAHIAEEPKGFNSFTGITMSKLTGFPADQSKPIFGFIALLLVISGLVMVIASVNVAGMLLARATVRRREMAVRVAIGAGRGRLIGQMLTESVVLFMGGAIGGVLIALLATRLFTRIQLPAEVPISIDLSPDYRVLFFALGSALVTGLLFGLAPALQATRTDPNAALRSDTAGSGAHRSWLRSGLVIGQMAISLLLLMSAGLFLRALSRGQHVDPGFDVAHVATAALDVGTSGYTDQRARSFYELLKQRLEAKPGVVAVSYAEPLPLSGSMSGTEITVNRAAPQSSGRADGKVDVGMSFVAPDFFRTMQLPLLRGRDFRQSDDSAGARVAIINEAFATRFWPGRDAVGQTFTEDSVGYTVVGVARNAKYSSLNEALEPFMYIPIAQDWRTRMTLLVRTTGDPATAVRMIHDAMHQGDPILPEAEVVTMENATSVVLLPQRVAAAVTGVMGALGLLLAVVGLYGVVAYTVSQRTREIGLRMALGADRANVLKLILRDGLRLIVPGMAIGMLLAVGATRVMSSFLFGVSPLDPLVFAVIPLGLGAATLLASYVPARRAAGTDPLEALRG